MAKKGAKHDPRLIQGKKILEEWGVNPSTLQDSSVAVGSLYERVGQNADADLALAALLGDMQAAESAQFLVSWEEKISDKRLRKEIHRAIYRLSQKGVHADRPEKETARSILTPVVPEGYISPMDGRGDRLVWLVKSRIGGGLHFLSSLVNEPEGMRYVEGSEVTRKMLRHARQDLNDTHQITMVEAQWQYCDFLMHEGYERVKAQGKKGVESYLAARSHLLAVPAEPQEVPVPVHLDRGAIAADENLLITSLKLFEEKELQGWLFDAEQAKPYVEKITNAQESPLVLNQQQQHDRVEDVIKAAVVEIFSDEKGQTYARRLEETALYLCATDRLEAAKRALAVSLALQKEGANGSQIPFCEGLVQQSIRMHYAEEKQQEQEEAKGSLIMKPSEFAARVQQSQRQR
jgi:hypothetical protein